METGKPIENTKPLPGITDAGNGEKNGRGGRRRQWEMTAANVRFFLPKSGTTSDRPELGREMASEAEALVEAFKTGQTFFTLVAWKAVSEIENGAPRIVKEALKRG